MSRFEDKLGLVVIGLIFGALGGVMITYGMLNEHWERAAVSRGYGEFHDSGQLLKRYKFRWKEPDEQKEEE